MIKFNSCGNCNNGYIFKYNTDGILVAERCSCRETFNREVSKKFNNDLLQIKIPKNYSFNSYLGIKSKNNIKILERFVDKFSTLSTHGLYVSGEEFTQKSTLVSYACYLLEKKGFRVLFSNFSNIFLEKLLYGFQESNKELMNILESDLLVIDDFFNDRIDPKILEKKYKDFIHFLEYRLISIKKPIIIISQKDWNSEIYLKKFKEIKSIMNNYNFYPLKFEDNYYQIYEKEKLNIDKNSFYDGTELDKKK